ncbi:hypothetical protein Agub_g4821 [Astrephomene gubernaculifera]|uniref:ABM domain-containing protein n=1 Tax=Astrephomene gubernaculifera TaxID=47775 RepID=A0AAD3DPT7_9CHLO|nr:hypothetical protein Agub_g4821 [Astrephomene gubernaculifera]
MTVLGHRQCFLPVQQSRRRLQPLAAQRVRSKRQIAVSRTLIAKKGHESQVASLAGEILKWTEQESQVSGKGILAFDCVRDGWEANTFHFWERYEDTTAFGTHSTAPRMMEMMKKLEPHLESPIGVALYSYENGRLGPVSMQAGPKGEGGLDDATGASGAAGGASYKQTSRAFDLTKVDEHEEAQRERQLLSSMSVDGGSGPDGAQQQEADGEGAGVPAFARGLLSLAAAFKEKVMAPVCRLLKHKH